MGWLGSCTTPGRHTIGHAISGHLQWTRREPTRTRWRGRARHDGVPARCRDAGLSSLQSGYEWLRKRSQLETWPGAAVVASVNAGHTSGGCSGVSLLRQPEHHRHGGQETSAAGAHSDGCSLEPLYRRWPISLSSRRRSAIALS